MQDWKPKLGMVFDGIENVQKFWVDYGEKSWIWSEKKVCTQE